jgi:hypothetical protein
VPSSDDAEQSIYRAVKGGLQRWLGRARDVVMAPWRLGQHQPNPSAIDSVKPAWQAEVDRILGAMDPATREGWVAANLPGDLDPHDPYIQANLALTKNLLMRIPDDVHSLVAAAIIKGVNSQLTTAQIADKVQNILDYTGSEDWDGRARLIAATEVNRHFNSSMLAHGLLLEKGGRRDLQKRWDTRMDGKERAAHHLANGDTKPLGQPFLVGQEPLLFPCDPRGRPDNVCNCRCELRILGGNP